jgi:tripartite-type tricarboxylate transporter receptor subunit TctC
MKMIKKLLGFSLLSLATLTASAEASYPSRPVTIVVPFPAGGGADYLARAFAEELKKKFNQPFLIDNRGGASGILAAEYVKRAKPDGYTIIFTPEPIVALNPVVFRNLPYSINDFAPIAGLLRTRVGVIVSAKSPHIQSFDSLMRHARANPGKLNYASFGVASSPQLAMELFNSLTGTEITHISYRGSAPAMQDLAAGNVDMTYTGRGSGGGLLTSGQVRMLAITGDKRSPQAPDVPTFKELDPRLENMKFTEPYAGMLAPAGTPAPIIQKLSLALKEILQDKEFVDRKFTSVNNEADWSSAQDYAKIIADITAFWRPFVQQAGIQAER